MNRYIALLIGAMLFGGLLGMVTGLYLASTWLEKEIRNEEAKKIRTTMQHNQQCVKEWKKTPKCVDWQ